MPRQISDRARRSIALLFVVSPLSWGCVMNAHSCHVPQPPHGFDHAPDTAITIVEHDFEDISSVCARLGAGPSQGCSDTTTMHIPRVGWNYNHHQQACIIHHEWGHINGATANHEGWEHR